jgi:hypothetical protein
MIPRPTAVCCLLACLFISACDHSGWNSGSGDARFAANAAPAWQDGRGWRFAATPSAVIGEAESRPDDQLEHVAGALIVSDSLVVVADGGARQIRYFSLRGTHLRTVGRQGNGPGEFRLIEWMGARRDTVVVWDPFGSRITVLGPGGTVARIVSVSAAAGKSYRGIGLLGDGSLLLREPDDREVPDGESAATARYQRVSTSDGARLDRIGPYALGERFTKFEGRNWVSEWVIFGKRGIITTAPQGIFTGTSDRFEMTLLGNDGHVVRAIGRPHHPRPASKADVEAALEQRRSGSDLQSVSPTMAQIERELFTRLPHRDTLPAFTRALVDGGGNLWMEEFRIDPDAEGTWSVFDPGGRWLGQVQTPAGVKVMSIARDAMVGVTTDEDDVERVVIYPLIR